MEDRSGLLGGEGRGEKQERGAGGFDRIQAAWSRDGDRGGHGSRWFGRRDQRAIERGRESGDLIETGDRHLDGGRRGWCEEGADDGRGQGGGGCWLQGGRERLVGFGLYGKRRVEERDDGRGWGDEWGGRGQILEQFAHGHDEFQTGSGLLKSRLKFGVQPV